MNRRILLSALSIFASTALVAGATFAFFSDTETSTGNTFTAGAIDLQIDNTSYLNGILNQGTTWLQKDLEAGVDFFFNFADLKPGDYGEDTISLHVDNNDAWVCADVTLTSDNDNAPTDPEAADDADTGDGLGELADAVDFIWWADDGDNVLEIGEQQLNAGPLGLLGVGNTAKVAIADSQSQIFADLDLSQNPLTDNSLVGDRTYYIGKAWCFGNFSVNPLEQLDAGGPDVRGAGFICDGTGEDDATQTDSMTADIVFRAVQARNNSGFECDPQTP